MTLANHHEKQLNQKISKNKYYNVPFKSDWPRCYIEFDSLEFDMFTNNKQLIK